MKIVIILVLAMILALGALSVWQRGQALSGETTVQNNPIQTDGSSAQMETQSNAPHGPIAPAIVSNTWLNSPVLASEDLRGKVVVVEFWTFG